MVEAADVVVEEAAAAAPLAVVVLDVVVDVAAAGTFRSLRLQVSFAQFLTES